MSCLSTVEAKLPPGFRFHPKDEELVYDYLMKWIIGSPLQFPLLIQVDLNKIEPWDMPQTACVGSKEWYFYSKKDRKYATGLRTNRATVSGYWKATGKDRPVVRKGTLIGMRKTLVFYQGRAPKGTKTDWIMHEFRLEVVEDQDWVLCRVFCKNNLRSSSPSSDQMSPTITNPSTHENPNPALISTPSSSSLPSLIEFPSHYNIEFERDINNGSNYHNGQVPCFSNFIYTANQPNSCHHNNTIPLHMNPTQEMLYGNISSCDDDKKVIASVLNHLTKKELKNNYQYCNNIAIKSSSSSPCSPNFVDHGNSESTLLSEVGFSSFWN